MIRLVYVIIEMPQEINVLLLGAVFAVVTLFYTAFRVATGKSPFEQDASPKWDELDNNK
jgi:hypothetical protein